MPDVTDYGPTIADLERKRDEIDRTIAMLRALAGMPAVEGSSRNGGSSGPVEFTNKHFFGMNVPDAVILYLESVKEARNATRIAQDLIEHGLTTSASAPTEVVRTALRRLEKAERVVQVKKEWGLPAWYPGLRGRQTRESGTDPEPRKASRPVSGKKGRPKSKKPTPKDAKGDRRPNPYSKFMGEQMAAGMTMAQAAAAWQAKKGE